MTPTPSIVLITVRMHPIIDLSSVYCIILTFVGAFFNGTVLPNTFNYITPPLLAVVNGQSDPGSQRVHVGFSPPRTLNRLPKYYISRTHATHLLHKLSL